MTLSLVAPPLADRCDSVVISYPPVIFGINVEVGDHSIPGFPIVSDFQFISSLHYLIVLLLQSTFDTDYVVYGLRPFTEYEVELSVSNMYTIRRSYIDLLFSSGIRFKTLEGGTIAQLYVSCSRLIFCFCCSA